jgi:hypothetical protein
MSEKEAQAAISGEAVVVEPEVTVEGPEMEGDARTAPRADEKGEAPVAAPVKELPVNSCGLCGKLPPGEEVWQCTLCLQKFCVKHLEPRLHYCYAGQST